MDEKAGAKKGIQYWKITISGEMAFIYFAVLFHEKGLTELINGSAFSPLKSKNWVFPGKRYLGYWSEKETRYTS
jgi:protein subunit release factor B|tara:strand:- start:195 stop:416 length:222 start_codon:yes stop_codon:yes gene_type:complete